MKQILLAGAMFLAFPGLAMAQTATGTGTGTAISGSGASASVFIQNPGKIDSNIRYRSSGSIKTTPNAIAPGLGSAAIETCYGPGVSGGVAVTGFGASFGMGQYDTACNRRLNARTLFAFGYKEQATKMMLNDPEVAAAFGYGPAPAVAPAGVAYQPASVRSGPAASGCSKWSGGSPGAGVCIY